MNDKLRGADLARELANWLNRQADAIQMEMDIERDLAPEHRRDGLADAIAEYRHLARELKNIIPTL